MSSPPAPTKPPRGVKQGKETSGLLMSVIRTLSASETNEQREKERAKLEKEYKKSDARLDELVAEHAAEIMEVMQKFSATGAALGAWGRRCDAAVARLSACRQLLRLRRDDLRRLWLEARTTHYALQMLTDIEQVVESAGRGGGRDGRGGGLVLEAACTLQTALRSATTSLRHVTALDHTREHLQLQKRMLVDEIIKGLNEAVYRGEAPPAAAAAARRPSARRRTALLLAELTKSSEMTDAYLRDVTAEWEATLSDEDDNFDTRVMISLEALAVLEHLNDAAEKFKVQIQSELLEVIATTSRRIIDEVDTELEADGECEQDGDMPQEGVTETARPLARLVATLSDEFRACAVRNKRLLQLWRAALLRHKISASSLHTEQHYWSAVQQVLQLLLTEYLDISSVSAAGAGVGAGAGVVGVGVGGGARADPPSDLRLADYFAKKRAQRKQPALYTYQPLVTSSTQTRRAQSYPLVSVPEPSLLYAVLPALHGLAVHIETNNGGGECSLRAFITNYVREGEADRVARAARAAIERAMREPGAWRERVLLQTLPTLPTSHSRGGGGTVVVRCCAAAWRGVEAAATRARAAAWCGGGEAARGALLCLAHLAAAARAHASLLPSASVSASAASVTRARAVRWLSDDDIVRFLQSLPNWRVATSIEPAAADDKNLEEELRQAYDREAEILGSSLGDGAITQREIIPISALTDLAVLCESMAWLSSNIRSLPSLLNGVKLSDKLLNDVSAAAAIFDEIQHKCMLLLHLELRIQCFYYLGQEGEVSGSTSGESPGSDGAARLAQALLTFHEQVSAVLLPSRLQYVLGGIGEMMSAGIVSGGGGGGGGGGGAAGGWGAGLATLRHCLAALQLPPRGLATAQRYLHLLASRPEEIIQLVCEKGAQFSELEYLNAFKIIGERRGISQADMKMYHKQLSSALGHIGVTV